MESFGTLMEMSLKESGSMIKPTVMESMSIRMELDMKENGRTIFNTDKVKRFGPTILCTRDIIMKVKSMERVFISGKMDQVTMETGMRIE
jgi:hypothetical protein